MATSTAACGQCPRGVNAPKKRQTAWASTSTFLNLAGEYRVAAELLKREIFTTITYGNRKGTNIYAIGPNRRTAVIDYYPD